MQAPKYCDIRKILLAEDALIEQPQAFLVYLQHIYSAEGIMMCICFWFL